MAEGERKRGTLEGPSGSPKDYARELRMRVRTSRPHPLAGRTGEGAPIAPPGWLWKAGNRASDMYFYSPSGQKFRSQLHLQMYLQTVSDPPPLWQFRWRIGPDDFKHVPLPGVAPPENEVPKKKIFKSEVADMSIKNKRMKLSVKKKTQQQQDVSKPPDGILRIEDGSAGFAEKLHETPILVGQIEDGQQIVPYSENTINKEIDQISRKDASMSFFSHLLVTSTSYQIFSKNAAVLGKFLNEAEKLREKSESELNDLRNLVMTRKYNPIQLSKYPENVLRVFYFLLRNEDAPAKFGKGELVELCSKWSCKYKHYWCLLERQRIELLSKIISNAEDQLTNQSLLEGKAALNSKDDCGRLLDDLNEPQHSSVIEKVGGEFQYISELSNNLFSENIPEGILGDTLRDREGHEANGISINRYVDPEADERIFRQRKDAMEAAELPSIVAQKSNGSIFLEANPLILNNYFLNEMTDKGGAICREDINYRVQSDLDYEPFNKAIQRHDSVNLRELQMASHHQKRHSVFAAEDLTTVDLTPEEPVSSQKATADKENKKLSASSNFVMERLENRSQQKSSLSGGGKNLIEKCYCQVCSKEPSFCYGCTCSLCRLFIEHKQSWSFINCPNCAHLCHLECAIKARRAGVVKDCGLDGELLCPCCNQKSDLVPFWRVRIVDALRAIDRLTLQQHLTCVVLLLNGTQRERHQTIYRNVMELHDSLFNNTHSPDLHHILHQIHEKLNEASAHQDPNDTVHLSVDALNDELLLEADKVSQCQKKAEADYVNWLMAERNANTQRMLLKDVTEQVEKAEADVKSKAKFANASKFILEQAEKRLQLLKRNSRFKALSNEQLELQRASLDLELSEFRKLQDRASQESSPQMYSLLLENIKMQQNRVEAAKTRLEQMIILGRFFQ
ncbi:hypothetical protein O6H91_04G100800 [Diphasiastrum complanatum]|uniref:Uncharacterized protein n=2 Tax=Diphasiastrum complanatum TaxID=34168 RepID=A0ACC2E038_DIPCM|nr:hypothetical protein O6H91_04G100800 [Diphasiastrum complanatum]